MIQRKMDYMLPDDSFRENMEQIVWPLLRSCCEETTLEVSDGAHIHARLYRREGTESVICISHGFTEFADKYAEVIYMFLRAGCSVAICEHRGHGFSDRAVENLSKVHIDSYDTYIRDYHCFVQWVGGEMPEHRRFLFGHSMGGCIATLYIEEYPHDFEACVLSSPLHEVDSKGLPKLACYLFGRAMVRHHHGEEYLGARDQDFDGEETFEDSCGTNYERWAYWAEYRKNDEHMQMHAGTIAWMTASLEAAHRAVYNAGKVEIPVLLTQAGQDNMVLPGGQVRFVRSCPDAKIRIFEEAKHETFNCTYAVREMFWKTVLAFFGLHGA